MSIERYLLVNLIMDLALLALVTRSCGVFSVKRMAASGALCEAYAVAAALLPAPWRSAPVQLMLLIPVSAIAAGRIEARVWGTTSLLLIVSALTAGGAAPLIPRSMDHMRILASLAGLIPPAVLLNLRHLMRAAWQMNVVIQRNGKTVRFTALIDTGNRLREPLSGHPVLIAEARLLRKILPVSGCRVVAFGALGGTGHLECFRPNAAWAERGRQRKPLPDIWVAILPGRLPGPAQALAPCEFADLPF